MCTYTKLNSLGPSAKICKQRKQTQQHKWENEGIRSVTASRNCPRSLRHYARRPRSRRHRPLPQHTSTATGTSLSAISSTRTASSASRSASATLTYSPPISPSSLSSSVPSSTTPLTSDSCSSSLTEKPHSPCSMSATPSNTNPSSKRVSWTAEVSTKRRPHLQLQRVVGIFRTVGESNIPSAGGGSDHSEDGRSDGNGRESLRAPSVTTHEGTGI